MAKITKCVANDDKLTMCVGMSMSVNGPGRAKGIRVAMLQNFNTGDVRYGYTSYHESAADVGIIMPFCPFCGENLIPPKTKEDNEEEYDGS